MKDHIYQNIEGWFDFESIYKEIVEKSKDVAHFVEIGAWLGKSTSYMAVEIANSGKQIKFDAIDTWEGSKGSWDEKDYNLNEPYQKFLDNIDSIKEFINPIRGWSYDVVDKYEDKSLDFIFIDGAHDYESVKRDIKDWFPKLKKGGTIGGHDYNEKDWPGVVQAVNEYFGEKNIKVIRNNTGSWVFKEMSICVITMCLNEEIMLPFFLDYYTNYVGVNKIVLYDGGSTDNTHKIIKEYSNTELILEHDEVTDSQRDLRIWNDEWKKYRNDYDWMIVCTPDEFLYHPNIKEKLLQYKNEGITLPLVEGFNMISLEHPKFASGNYLPYIIKRGIKDPIFMNKNIIFNPKELDINYRIGCHACDPTGNVVYSKEEFNLLHFQKLSYEFLIRDSKRKGERLSQWMIDNNAGYHYKTNSQMSIEDYTNDYNKTKHVLLSLILDNNTNLTGEELKIQQLTELENLMKIENDIQLIGDEIVIKINSTKENGKCQLVLPYLQNRGYDIIEKSDYLILSKKKDKDIYIFSHNYLINNWEEILKQQLYKLKISGLYKNAKKLFLFAYGNDEQWNKFKTITSEYDKIEIKRHDNNFYEYHTLQAMWEFCQLNDESYILYFHLKGVWSRHNIQTGDNDEFDPTKAIKNPEALTEWKNCLEYFNIERWCNAVDKLNEGHDVVGALYNYNPDCPLFTGNFWWANSKFIKKLEYPQFIKENEPHNVNLWIRIKCEKWINSIKNIFYNLYTPIDLDLYHVVIRPEEYRDDINPLISIITSTYKRYDELKDAIQSVVNQTYKNWQMLICSDGIDDKTREIVKSYDNVNIKYFNTMHINDYGSTQKNSMVRFSRGKYLMYLDDDNVIYPHYLETVVKNFDDKTGMIICHIDYDGLKYTLPVEDTIKLGKIDTLCLCVDKYYVKNAIWKNYAGQDYEFMKICENNILNHNKEVKFIPDVLGRHMDRSIQVNNKIVVFHHNYLRFNWENILRDQLLELKSSGLYDSCDEIIATIYSDPDNDNNRNLFKRNIRKSDPQGKWKIFDLYKNNFEYDALTLIKNYIDYKDENLDICYFHLKGVCSEQLDEPNIGIPYWRNYLNYFTITKWKDNIEKLKYNDVIGLDYEFNEMHQRNVLGGHFFWSKSSYIKTLQDPVVTTNRYLPEIWITSNEKCKVYSNFNVKKAGVNNLYLQPIYESYYKEVKDSKVVYVMSAHPSFKMSEDITKRSITAIKDDKIILSSHYPVSNEIQSMVDYYVFDKINPLIKHDFFTVSWFTGDEYKATLDITKEDNNFNHALGVFLNYYNGLLYAKSQGFNIAVCTNFDLVFSKDDKEVINERIRRMSDQNKKAFFMNTNEREGTHYKTIFFITNIDYFLNTFKYITNEEVYIEEMRKVGSNTNCLENFVYHTLKNKTEDLLLEEINEDQLFPTSQINLFSLIEYNTILPIENDPDHFIAWFSSANSLDNRDFNMVIKKNGNNILNDIKQIDKRFIYYKKIKFTQGDNFEISFVTKSENEILKFKKIKVNDEVFANIRSYGNFQELKNIESI